MTELAEKPISCPYCGEIITILVDDSLPAQEYVEDCQVCCQPMTVGVAVDGAGGYRAEARREED